MNKWGCWQVPEVATWSGIFRTLVIPSPSLVARSLSGPYPWLTNWFPVGQPSIKVYLTLTGTGIYEERFIAGRTGSFPYGDVVDPPA